MKEIQDSAAIVRLTASEIRQAYGKKPLLLGLLTSDPFKLNLGYTVGGFVLLASGLWTFVLALAYFWANDFQASSQEFAEDAINVNPAHQELDSQSPFPVFQPQKLPTPSPDVQTPSTPTPPLAVEVPTIKLRSSLD